MYYGSGTVARTASQWRHTRRARKFSRKWRHRRHLESV